MMNKLNFSLSAVALTVFSLCLWQPAIAAAQHTAKPTAHIIVQAQKKLGPVNPQTFGQNISDGNGSGLWDVKTHQPVKSTIDFLKALRPGVLRYPGGTNVRRYFWDKAIGPVQKRAHPNHLGLDEFLKVCRLVGAQPDITVNMTRTPADAANLVQYLNAPATQGNPWAMKRKKYGHPKPYHVRYFEMGNENYYVDTPEQYVQDFIATAKAMRAVDPDIQLGFVTSPLIHPLYSDWNITVMKKAGKLADFAIVHNYPGWYAHKTPDKAMQKILMKSIMASAPQTQHRLDIVHQMMRKYIGRDLPIALTEYNAGFVQDKPRPLRFSLGAALFSADYRRVLLRPSNHILFATYWHFLNGYWGMIRTPARTHADHTQIMPAYQMFKLWGQHFGDTLVQTYATGPKLTFQGRLPITWPATGDHYQASVPISKKNLVDQVKLQASKNRSYRIDILNNNKVRITLNNLVGHLYPSLAKFSHSQGILPKNVGAYQITFEARYLPVAGSAIPELGLQLGDIRGWDKTHSAVTIMGAQKSQQWKTFHASLDLRPGAPGGAQLLVRLLGSKKPASGTLEIRHIRVLACYRETYPAYNGLTAKAGLSKDGHKLYLMVFNKTIDQSISTQIDIQGFTAQSARRWTVDAPGAKSGLDSMTDSKAVLTAKAKPVDLTSNGSMANLIFPAHSMTALVWTRK